MNRQLKQELKESFAEIKPQHKTEFLQKLNMPKESKCEFVWTQLAYTHKLGWLISVALLLFVFWLGGHRLVSDWPEHLLWMVSAVLPLFALTVMLEGSRSTTYGMAELESCTKYSLADVIMIRMGALSFCNIIVILAAFFLVRQHVSYSILQTGIYLFFPYLLTCVLTLAIQNRGAGRSTRWYCAVASGLISMLALSLPELMAEWYGQKYLNIWLILVVLLSYQIGKQIQKMKINMEAGLWSLYLTE